jgi:hypothetical protein
MVFIAEFYKNKGNKDGLAKLCKNCYIYSCYGGKRIRQKQVVIPEYNIDTSKWCNKCETVRDRSEFHNAKNTSDGLSPNCKSCKKEQKLLYKNKLIYFYIIIILYKIINDW